jgi:DNA-binding response OmpR family regulator
MSVATVLLVEGGTGGDASLSPALAKTELRLYVAHTASEALEWTEKNELNLVVVNAATMRSSGVRTCRRLRKTLGDTPIIHCRKHDQPLDNEAGADIYLAQPFTARKLMNRIRTLLPADYLTEEIVKAGNLTFFLSKRSVDVSGRGEKRLTPKLADLLLEFLNRPSEVLSRQELMESVWQTNYFGDTRTLDVHIRWVREIIEENPAQPRLLRTVRGVGYIFEIPLAND